MSAVDVTAFLGQVPDSTVYISAAKLVVMLALFTLWVLLAQWMDKDAKLVNTWQVPFNMGMMAVGVAATAAMLLVPLFLAGAGVFVVLVAGYTAAYVVHRNGLVTDDTKVFTPSHFQRLLKEGLGGKGKKLKEVKERVRLTDAERKTVAIPTEPVAREQFRLTQDLLFDVLWNRAALVELVPAGQAAKVRYVVDGVLSERPAMQRADADAVLAFLKQVAGLNLEEKRKPQSGRIGAAIGENRVDIFVRTGGTTAGEKLVLQMIGKEAHFKVEDLGFTKDQIALVRELMVRPKGLILLSSPPAQGLSTTFYSFARSHDAFLNNIQTLELNRQFDLDNITRHVFKPSEDRTFANELLKITRTDPDIIFVPELRDAEAAAVVCRAADHKQRMYVGLNAEDVFDALKQWVALVNDKALVAKALNAVFNQRLIRVLCTECKQPYKPPVEQLRKINLPQDKVYYRQPEPQYDKNGNPIICQNCHGSGYVGRTAVFDIMLVDDGLREVLSRGGSIADVKTYVTKKGAGGLLQRNALDKAVEGLTSFQEVTRVMRAAATGATAPKPAPAAAGPAA